MASSAFSFSDDSGVSWNCRVTWAAIRRSAAAGVDLSKIEEYLGDFYRCSPLLVDAVWAVCCDDAYGLGVERPEFERRLTGDTLEAAREALISGIENFFPKGRGKLIRAAANEVAEQVAALVEQVAAEHLPNSSTGSPVKSE